MLIYIQRLNFYNNDLFTKTKKKKNLINIKSLKKAKSMGYLVIAKITYISQLQD